MTATLERDTLKISQDTLERLREMGLTDGTEFEVQVEDGRLVAVLVSPQPGVQKDADPKTEGEPLSLGRRLAPNTDLAALAEARGVRPLARLESLRGDFWPEDESEGEFEATLREWRDEAKAAG